MCRNARPPCILHDVIGSEPLLDGDDGETERLFVLALGQLLGNVPCATPSSSPLWKGESSECSNISAEQGACQEPDADSEDQQKCRYAAGD
jgi:hypothetical protein